MYASTPLPVTNVTFSWLKYPASALNRRGNTLAALDRPDEALAAYDTALSIVPDHAEVLNNRAVVLVNRGFIAPDATPFSSLPGAIAMVIKMLLVTLYSLGVVRVELEPFLWLLEPVIELELAWLQ